MKGIAIIAAAGKGQRAGVDKIWIKTANGTVLERAVAPFFDALTVDEVCLVVAPSRVEEAKALFCGGKKPCVVLAGGETRTQSVKIALEHYCELKEDAVVAIHDGARPYVSRALIERAMQVAAEKGSAVPVVPCSDSLRRVTGEGSVAMDRGNVYRVQTPQCFSLKALLKAYSSGEEATDDATLYEKHVGAVALVEGEESNVKITYLSDVCKDFSSRVGVGFDVHPLVKGRPLILGGVKIDFEKGLDGHSDADVLVHAVMDALLTAAGLPDIGHWFPPNDPKYEGADSVELLKTVIALVKKEGFSVANVSATVMAEAPKLAPYLSKMEKIVAKAVGVDESAVKFAATTTERLGIVGEGKGIAAEAVALLCGGKN
ncbi:MAG: 2-C-methyl-D-erythritol 2,4-cyclodiphosphate synthase [Clostridia bacterium]|nr:2-C-methyl-D-erythritol 2,4-cyclodiphosphate synthase [Clostridia bacterium]